MKIIVFILFSIISLFSYSSNNPNCSQQMKINSNGEFQDKLYVKIGGIEQWVAIRAKSCSNPILLIIHGGPGTTSSHYTNEHFDKLENKFIVVHWDQRGSGKTFGKSISTTPFDDYLVENPLSISQLVADGVEVSKYLLQRFGKKKLVLRGGSWGAYLAINMIHAEPSLYSAYVGHSQLVNANEKLKFGYEKSLELAQLSNNIEKLNVLKELSTPPYDHPRKYGKLVKIIKGFENENATHSTRVNTIIASYNTEQDRKDRFLADDYSWMHFVGFKRLGIKGMQNSVDLTQLDFDFSVPIFIFQGGKDLTTPAYITSEYFKKIQAPIKEYFLISDAGHEPSDKMLDAELALLVERVIPLAEASERELTLK